MKVATLIAVGLALLLPIAASSASDKLLSAGYELVLQVGKDKYQIRQVEQFSSSVPLIKDFGKHQVRMVFSQITETSFVILVKVVESEHGGHTATELLEERFNGALGGITEFETSRNEVDVSGAIALSVLE